MRYYIEIKYGRGPWMFEGEFTSLQKARKEAKRMLPELFATCKRFRLRIVRWESVTVETHDTHP